MCVGLKHFETIEKKLNCRMKMIFGHIAFLQPRGERGKALNNFPPPVPLTKTAPKIPDLV